MPVGGSQLVQQANEHVTYYKSLKKSGCTSVVPNRLGKVFPVPGNSIPDRSGMLFPVLVYIAVTVLGQMLSVMVQGVSG